MLSMLIAGSFALLGYWPILPFAGLELAVLGWGLVISLRRGQHREVIQVDPSRIMVEQSRGRQQLLHDFQTPWTWVELVPSRNRGWPSRLVLNSMGRQVEIGQFLTEPERKGLARRLGTVIGPGQQLRFAAPGQPERSAQKKTD